VYYYANGYFDYDLVQEDGGQIIIASASSLVITGLQTTSCTTPVLIFYSDTIEMSGLELSGAGVGVTMVGSTAINIIGGSISNMSIGIMGTGTTNAIISEMHLVGNFMGISMDNQVDRCAQLIINNNLIEDSGLYGIVYDGVDQSVIHNNVIANSTGYGMRIMASTEVMVTSNLFYRNNGVGDIYSVPPFQVFDDTLDSIYDLYGWGNFWSEQLGPDADGDGLVDEFAYEIAGWMHSDYYPLAFVFTSEPLTEARNRIAYEYQATLDNEGVFGLVTDASFLSIDPETGLVSGTPDSFGTFHVNVSATLMGYLTIWQNYTLVIEDTWAPEIAGEAVDGKETVEYVYEPQFNETVTDVIADTDAPFLVWNGTAFVGTPGLSHAGGYYVNITATSLDGLLTSYLNQTFTVEDSWTAQFENAPADGQETVSYVFEPQFNETAAITGHETNAPFLSWNGTAFVGTPTTADAGEYWINITVVSVDGLLESYLNSSFIIGDSWAPSFLNAPGNGQETLEYVYVPEFNETAVVTAHLTNAPFLSWNGTAFVGTPTTADAGEYWINITAFSVDGLLGSYQNLNLMIGEAWSPEFANAPGDGQETMEYIYAPLFNETVSMTATETNAPFLTWNGSAFVGTPTIADAGTYWINITAISVDGLLEAFQNTTFAIGDSWSPEVVSAAEEHGRETLDYVYAPEANETVVWSMNTNAPFLDWNGSAVVGLPNVTSAGTYYVNLTAVSLAGLLSSWQNYTLVINDTWAAELTNGPAGGQETVNYVFEPAFNETVTITGHATNAPFLSWNGTAFVGAPTVADAGQYWVSVMAASVPGLLDASWNLTFMIGEAWAPEIVSEPPASDLWASLEYSYQLEANESVVFTLSTDAGFLNLVNGTISGTMGAGSFYVNVTATSVNGLLSSYQNFTLTVGTDDAAPSVEIISPADGARLNVTSVMLELNVTDEGSGVAGIWVRVGEGNWTSVSGTNLVLLLPEGENSITVRSVDAVGNEAEETVSVLIDLTAPTVTSFTPQGEDEALDAPIVITFSEAMDAGSVIVIVNGQPAIITWNGSLATVAGDWEYATEYTVLVTGQDLAGNAMEPMSFSFTTAAQLVTISGVLLDAEGNPVANANISVNGVVVAVTGEDGSYSFQLTPGEYLVAVTAEGFDTQSLPLTVGTEPSSLDVVMHGTQEASNGSLWWLALVMIAIILGMLYLIRRQF
jgi:hypothetical protein